MNASTATRSQGHASVLVNEQYRIAKRLGGGSFGDIFLGVGQNGEQVAVKFEKHSTRCPQLRHEYKVYRELQNCSGFGRVYFYGTHNNFNAMVMDLFGPSLEDLFTKCGRRFSLKTVLQIADQLLERMETMHSRHLIHRDVKPANFVLGTGNGSQTIFCIDFGLSTRYRHPRTLQHIPYRRGRSLTGTPRYASVNNHLGVEQSRRDDLESIGFVLVYFLKGSLPWQGLKARNAKRKYKIIMERKQAISIQHLCQGLPQQFAEYLAYCRSLKFEAKPNVAYLQRLLQELYKVQGHASSGAAEWDWGKFESPSVSSGGGDNTAADMPPTTGCGVISTVHDNKVPTAGDTNDHSHGGEPSIGIIGRHDKAGTALYSKWDAGKRTSGDTNNSCQPDAANGEIMENSGARVMGRISTGGSASNRQLRPNTRGTFWGEGTTQDSSKVSANKVSTTSVPIDAAAARGARPHTAHGPRAHDIICRGPSFSENDRVEVTPAVAGARGMMRYRSERTACEDWASTGYRYSNADAGPSSTGQSPASHVWSRSECGRRRRDTVPNAGLRGRSDDRAAGARSSAMDQTAEMAYLRRRETAYGSEA